MIFQTMVFEKIIKMTPNTPHSLYSINIFNQQTKHFYLYSKRLFLLEKYENIIFTTTGFLLLKK